MQVDHSPPSDQEFDELEAFLESSQPEPGLPIDAIDGMMAAMVCGPDLVKPSEWMPAVWHHTMPEYESQTQAQRILDILMKWFNSVVEDIDAGTYQPMMAIWDVEGSSEAVEYPEDWCLGFLEGMKFRSAAWETRAKNDTELMDMLRPILNAAEASDAFAQSLLVRRRVIRRISDAVLDIRDYWRQQRPLENRDTAQEQ
jgi:uncharacterized protein